VDGQKKRQTDDSIFLLSSLKEGKQAEKERGQNNGEVYYYCYP
jgi:hypothetical protein